MPRSEFRKHSLLLATFLLAPLLFGAVEPWAYSLLELSAFALLLGSFPRFEGGRAWSDLNPFAVSLAALLVLGAVQYLNAAPADQGLSVLPSTAFAWGTRREWFLWAAYAALFCAASSSFRSPRARAGFLWVLGAAAAALSFFGIFKILLYGVRELPWWADDPKHAFGFYYNKNHAGSLLALALPLLSGAFLGRWSGFRQERRVGKAADILAQQALLGMAILIIAYALHASRSRGAQGSFALAALLTTASASLIFRKPVLAVPALIALAAAASPSARDFFLDSRINQGIRFRMALFRSVLDIFKDFPAFGSGLGSFMAVMPAYQPLSLGLQATVGQAHNDWLQLLAETGLAGFTAYCVGFGLCLARILYAWRKLPSSPDRWLVGGGLTAILAFCCHGLVDFNLHIPANAALFIATIAWTWSVAVPRALREPEAAPGPRRPAAWLPVAAAYSFLAFVPCKTLYASWLTFRAQAAPEASRAYYLERDVRLEPDEPDAYLRLSGHYLALARSYPAAKLVFLRKALAEVESSSIVSPLNTFHRTYRSYILCELGRRADWIEDANDARRMEPWDFL